MWFGSVARPKPLCQDFLIQSLRKPTCCWQRFHGLSTLEREGNLSPPPGSSFWLEGELCCRVTKEFNQRSQGRVAEGQGEEMAVLKHFYSWTQCCQNTDGERNKITILLLDSVPNIKKGNGSSPFTFCFIVFTFGRKKPNNGYKYF